MSQADYGYPLLDPVAYAALEKKALDCFLTLISNAEEWTIPYFNTTFSNRKPCQDGNPLFSARYNNYVVRIIVEDEDKETIAILQERSVYQELLIVVSACHIEEITGKIRQWTDLSPYIKKG